MIDSEYGNDILTLEDDDGVEHTFEVLDSIENAGTRYLALSPIYDDPQQTLADSGELVILRVVRLTAKNFWKPSTTRTRWTKSPTSSWSVWRRTTTSSPRTRTKNKFLFSRKTTACTPAVFENVWFL